jgi:hypothetical protein
MTAAACFVIVQIATGRVVYVRPWSWRPEPIVACETLTRRSDRRYRIVCSPTCPEVGAQF